MRVLLLILSALFSIWGFLGGLVLMAVLIATKTFGPLPIRSIRSTGKR